MSTDAFDSVAKMAARCQLAATVSSPADSGVVDDCFVRLKEVVSRPAAVPMADWAFVLAGTDVFGLAAKAVAHYRLAAMVFPELSPVESGAGDDCFVRPESDDSHLVVSRQAAVPSAGQAFALASTGAFH